MKSSLLFFKSSSPILVKCGLGVPYDCSGSNDNGTGGPTLAPQRSSLPQGYRSDPPAVWMDHSIQILKDNRNRTHRKWGSDSFYQYGDLRSTSNCLDKTSRQSPCLLR